MKNNDYLLLAWFCLLLSVSLTSAQYANAASGVFSGNNYQAYQPTIGSLNAGPIDTYWPMLNSKGDNQCEAATDFIIGIPRGGCTPNVVRSDLLAEQNIPVFCQLYAIKINPLIKTSAIKSISFKGDQPEGVAGISFHPARAAVKSYSSLLGDPTAENIGYVVIVLKRTPAEKDISEVISGMLTATIYYDADMAYGTGRSQYYVPILSDDEWESQYQRYSFWQGRGFLRVTDISRDSARVQVLESKDRTLNAYTLKEGETSSLSYLPGYYCKAGLKVKLNSLATPEDSALISIDGSDLWVRQGSKVLNDACTVSSIALGEAKMGGVISYAYALPKEDGVFTDVLSSVYSLDTKNNALVKIGELDYPVPQQVVSGKVALVNGSVMSMRYRMIKVYGGSETNEYVTNLSLLGVPDSNGEYTFRDGGQVTHFKQQKDGSWLYSEDKKNWKEPVIPSTIPSSLNQHAKISISLASAYASGFSLPKHQYALPDGSYRSGDSVSLLKVTPVTDSPWKEAITARYTGTVFEYSYKDIFGGEKKVTAELKNENLVVVGSNSFFRLDFSDNGQVFSYYVKKEAYQSASSYSLSVYGPKQKSSSGTVRISCPGKTLTLEVRPRQNDSLYVQNKESEYAVGNGALVQDNFGKANATALELAELYPSESKGGSLGTYGEEALFEQIILAERTGKSLTAEELIRVFLKKYPSSVLVNELLVKQQRLGAHDYARAVDGVFVNGKFYSFVLLELYDKGFENKSVTLGVAGRGLRTLRESEKFVLSNDNEFLEVKKINAKSVTVDYVNTHPNANPTRDSKTVFEGDRVEIGPKVELSVTVIQAKEMAYISLLPEVENTKTEANFTFKIEVEKRAIKLSPDKTREMLKNINDSIKKFEDINEKLGLLVKSWKGACFATSAVLTLKTMASGFDGSALARQKVMQEWRVKCDRDSLYGPAAREKCYFDNAAMIESDVEEMTAAMAKTNEVLKSAQGGNTESGGLLEQGSIRNSTQYLTDVRSKFGDQNQVLTSLNGVDITPADLETTSQLQAALTYNQLKGSGSTAEKIALQNLDASVAHLALAKKSRTQSEAAAMVLQKDFGTSEITVSDVFIESPANPTVVKTSGKTLSSYGIVLNQLNGNELQQKLGTTDPAKIKAHFISSLNGQKKYLAILGGGQNGQLGIVEMYESVNKIFTKIDIDAVEYKQYKNYVFVDTSSPSGLECSNQWPANTAEVIFHESGTIKGLPAIVPFDLTNGWYVKVSSASGSLTDIVPQGYTDAGDVKYFTICNIGRDQVMSHGNGDDVCQSFNTDSARAVGNFPCPSMSQREVDELYYKAREAIRQASGQKGQRSISVFNQVMNIGDPVSQTSVAECTDFMSPADCKLMFNVCDPVICPPSRCDMGGQNPVSDVIQTGIIGSIVQCFPNYKEGIYVPICISGIHAGIDAYTTILKAEQQCLQRSLDTGELVGICDEMMSVYKCEFFWKQAAPLLNQAVPKLISGVSGFGSPSVKGGGEYLFAEAAWDNTQKSIDYFKGTYAQNAFRAFEVKNVEEAGGTFCKAFMGSSFPTSADAFDSLLEPESPMQFYAYFSENLLSEATVPATSQYKVYFHIYAGKDVSSSYKVYLKNPPASSYYQTNAQVTVKVGYLARGDIVDETLDFTAPAGYKELCVSVGSYEECGFRQVTTSAGLDYLQKKYSEDQASQQDIVSEKECISGSPSAYGLVSPNLQDGVSESVQPDIALRGIVRVCATDNPGKSVGDFSRWQDIGFCGESRLRCWQDKDSVSKDLQAIASFESALSPTMVDTFGVYNGQTSCPVVQEKLRAAVANKAISYKEIRIRTLDKNIDSNDPLSCDEITQVTTYLQSNTAALADIQDRLSALGTTKTTYQGANTILAKARADIKALSNPTVENTKPILDSLTNITGSNALVPASTSSGSIDTQNTGAGSNAQKAEALALKATIFRLLVIEGLKKETPMVPAVARPTEEPKKEAPKTENKPAITSSGCYATSTSPLTCSTSGCISPAVCGQSKDNQGRDICTCVVPSSSSLPDKDTTVFVIDQSGSITPLWFRFKEGVWQWSPDNGAWIDNHGPWMTVPSVAVSNSNNPLFNGKSVAKPNVELIVSLRGKNYEQGLSLLQKDAKIFSEVSMVETQNKVYTVSHNKGWFTSKPTDIFFRYVQGVWSWSPDKKTWMNAPIIRVSAGEWKDEVPITKNQELILSLEGKGLSVGLELLRSGSDKFTEEDTSFSTLL